MIIRCDRLKILTDVMTFDLLLAVIQFLCLCARVRVFFAQCETRFNSETNWNRSMDMAMAMTLSFNTFAFDFLFRRSSKVRFELDSIFLWSVDIQNKMSAIDKTLRYRLFRKAFALQLNPFHFICFCFCCYLCEWKKNS